MWNRLAALLLMAFVARTQSRDPAEEFRQFIVKIHTAMALEEGSMVADIGTGDSPDHPTHITKAIGPGVSSYARTSTNPHFRSSLRN